MSDLLQGLDRSVVADYDRLRDDCALIELANVSLLELAGEDRKGWLQGQVTQNLREFDTGSSRSFCFCTQSGQVISVVDAWAVPDRFLLTMPKSTVAAVQDHIERMVVIETVSQQLLSPPYRLFSVQGPRATSVLSELIPLPLLDAAEAELEGAPVFVFRSNRTGSGGWDVWIPAAKRKAVGALKAAIAPISDEAFEIARIEAGIPAFGTDITLKTIPMEMGDAFIRRTVSLNKGCYVGQEVLQRIHSRGHTNRTWVGLVAEEPLTDGMTVHQRGNESQGTVTSVAVSPELGPIGAAVVRNAVAFDGESVRITDGTRWIAAEVKLMPLLRFD